MSCGGNPASFYPDPNARSTTGRAYQFNNPRRSPSGGGGGGGGRSTFFDRRLHRASALAQDPRSATLRELALILFGAFALYRASFFARAAHRLLLLTAVGNVCPGQNAPACMLVYGRSLWALFLYEFAAGVVPWAFVGALAVFFGEEALAALKGGKKK